MFNVHKQYIHLNPSVIKEVTTPCDIAFKKLVHFTLVKK